MTLKEKIIDILSGDFGSGEWRLNESVVSRFTDKILKEVKKEYVISKSLKLSVGGKEYSAEEIMEIFEAEQEVLDEIRRFRTENYFANYDSAKFLKAKIKFWQSKLKQR